MNLPLLVLGIAILVFGAIVLIRFSDRPGATVKWLGLEISSKGAGLPLIGLGIVCAVLAAQGGSSLSESADLGGPSVSSVPSTPQGSGNPSNLDTECLNEFAATVPNRRVGRVEEGFRDLVIVDSSQPQQDPFVIMLTDGGAAVGALRVRKFESGDASTLFKLESVVDAGCDEVDDLANVSRGGNPRSLMNWDTVRMRFGDRQYDLRIGGEGEIGVNFFRRAN